MPKENPADEEQTLADYIEDCDGAIGAEDLADYYGVSVAAAREAMNACGCPLVGRAIVATAAQADDLEDELGEPDIDPEAD
jgi:hypothetical protein